LLAVDISTDGVILKRFTVIPNLTHPIPGYVYVFAFLGAGAYAITSLAFNPKESIVETYRLTYRLIGALPLAAGVYLLAGVLGNSSDLTVPIAGMAFLSGLYVRLTLRRLGDVAERLYGEQGGSEAEADTRRNEANENLRHGWRLLHESTSPRTDPEQVRAFLRRAEAIVDDENATIQELERARELSEQALGAVQGREISPLGGSADPPTNRSREDDSGGTVPSENE